jgi:maltooligosyltrehalose synthase
VAIAWYFTLTLCMERFLLTCVGEVYKSPGKDMGYDISDYKDIDPRYGSMQDIENLTDSLHVRDMKLVMDLVVNHTSDQVSPCPLNMHTISY